MQSGYHNLPTINGLDEKDGADFLATKVEASLDAVAPVISMELSTAYPLPADISYLRKVTLEKEASKVNNQIKSDVGPTEVLETESVEVEVVDSFKEVKIQILKNNKQREEYINNDSSYVLIDLLSNNFIQIYELINTPFIKIKVLCNDYNYCNDKNLNPSFRTLGFYKLYENGALSSLLSYNESSIVAWLRDNKI